MIFNLFKRMLKENLPLRSFMIPAIRITTKTNEDTTITANCITTFVSLVVSALVDVRKGDDMNEPVD